MICPLCSNTNHYLFHKDNKRDYYRCRECLLVFVPDHQRLGAEEEKAVYDTHRNSPDDPGYRKFLSRVLNPLCSRVKPPARGLDFGSGPGPALSVMFEEKGYRMANYDPFYSNSPDALAGRYDFITCTEVFEHLFYPGKVLKNLFEILRPEGVLGIMTKLVIDRDAFAGWHYIHDPTHVCFFSRETFNWIAARLGCRLDFEGNDVIIMDRNIL